MTQVFKRNTAPRTILDTPFLYFWRLTNDARKLYNLPGLTLGEAWASYYGKVN